jgi:hypothetical protein
MIRAYVSDQQWGMGVSIGLVQEQENDRPQVMRLTDGQFASWETIEPGAVVSPTMTLDDAEARALLDGLMRHFHGAVETGALRKDYDAERARVDKLTDHLCYLAGKLAAAAGAARPADDFHRRAAMSCDHQQFAGAVEVSRLTGTEGGPVTGYAADIKIKCADCGRPFRFVGVPGGVSPNQPTVSLAGDELRAPIEPMPAWIAASLASTPSGGDDSGLLTGATS